AVDAPEHGNADEHGDDRGSDVLLEAVHRHVRGAAAGARRRDHGIHLPGEQSVRPGRRPRQPVLQEMTKTSLGTTAVAVVCLAGAVAISNQPLAAQTAQDKPLMTQDIFTSVTVLRDIPIDTFFDAMGMFANAMGNDCTFCHVPAAAL